MGHAVELDFGFAFLGGGALRFGSIGAGGLVLGIRAGLVVVG